MMRALLCLVVALAAAVPVRAEDAKPDPIALRAILRHGPWPQPVLPDPSNRGSGNAAAIALGQRLFADVRLSRDGTLSCAACHVPNGSFTDARAQGVGRAPLLRNTPTLWNVGLQHWFGWDGAQDSLWAQSVRPILAADELAADAKHVARLIRGDAELACLYRKAFGDLRSEVRRDPRDTAGDDARVLVDAGKALAAFQETLVSGRTPFDEYRDALVRADRAAIARYPAAAARGLAIFVGRGNCSVCHFGANFSNGEFHDVGVPFFAGRGQVDAGRYEGIRRLQANPYNLLGAFSDDASGRAATKTRHVDLNQRTFGQFRTPSLRNVALTAPYMHNGRLASLRDVVRHYSELDPQRVHSHGEAALLQPLQLTDGESDDLVAFLESLTDPAARAPLAAPRACRAL
jgi:cytochrome c peroxidase